jgi:hypothetical protein
MKHEVRAIPPAPRRLRLRPLGAHRWPLLAVGGAMVVLGGLIAWALFLHRGGKASLPTRLDQGPTAAVVGTVRDTGQPFASPVGELVLVRYRFPWQQDGQPLELHGESFVAMDRTKPGDTVPVQVLVAEPNVNRIRGGLLAVDRFWLESRFWLAAVVGPGGLLLLGWLAGVFQLWRVLVHGDVSVAVVHQVARLRYVLPEMLRVDYTFRDHHAVTRHHRHWVRLHGPLGMRLLEQLQSGRYEEMPVLHDRRLPQWNRLVLPQDFLPTAAAELPRLDDTQLR